MATKSSTVLLAAATLQVMRSAAEADIAYVCGTTGFSDAERAEIGDLAARIPIVHAPNFSVSVNILSWLTREAARRLGSGYDAELVEIHHSEKRDAPSGTSLHLAEAIAAARNTWSVAAGVVKSIATTHR